MELHILTEPEASPFPGFRYHLIINELLELRSNAVFDDWIDALLAGIQDWLDGWEAIAG